MFKSLVKVGLIPVFVVSGLEAIEWTEFADFIEKDPSKYCHKVYNDSTSISVADRRYGIPDCKVLNNTLYANVTFKFKEAYAYNVTSLKDFYQTAIKAGYKREQCRKIDYKDLEGSVCESTYNGYTVKWRMIGGRDYYALELVKKIY